MMTEINEIKAENIKLKEQLDIANKRAVIADKRLAIVSEALDYAEESLQFNLCGIKEITKKGNDKRTSMALDRIREYKRKRDYILTQKSPD